MERGPHEGGANHLPRLQRLVELLAPEPLDAGPESDEGRFRLLRLQPAEPLDGLDGRDRFSRQQQLARQRGAVQLSQGQGFRLQDRPTRLVAGIGVPSCGILCPPMPFVQVMTGPVLREIGTTRVLDHDEVEAVNAQPLRS